MGHKYFFIKVDYLSDRTYNTAVQVFKLTKEYPTFIGANYKLVNASNFGYAAEARKIVIDKCNHRLDKNHSFYSDECFISDVEVSEL